jgi:hypothetical protein
VRDPQDANPDDSAQRIFTDPESRIMPDGANRGAFVQGHNAQTAVDGGAQIIVACDVTHQANDKKQRVPMAAHVMAALQRLADVTSADAGYFSEAAVDDPSLASTDLLVPPHRQKHGTPSMEPGVAPAPNASAKDRMRHKLATADGRTRYRMRKAIVEPVVGQIKGARGFRRFLLRGMEAVRAKFALIALTHNLLKLFRSGKSLAMARRSGAPAPFLASGRAESSAAAKNPKCGRGTRGERLRSPRP